jgi:mitochondrial import inner membrane translocase subunit TIM22
MVPFVLPFTVPIYPEGREPLPPGLTEADRDAWNQQLRMQKYIQFGAESCVAKTVMAGGGGKSLVYLIFLSNC